MEVNEEVAEAESAADLSGISEANKAVLKSYVAKVAAACKASLPLCSRADRKIPGYFSIYSEF